MTLDFKHCYKAVRARDRRFDGLFFTAVKTTKIYCRSVCPAKTPRSENIEFFKTSVEAEARSYRPCLRCRPETAPGSPAWCGTSATVTRAIRLIHEGACNEVGTAGLSERLGVSQRHLNRLFVEHVGIPAGAFSRTFRIQTAKSLLNTTNLPITEVALASGFKSIRRFNDAFKESYGVSPREIRRINDAGKDNSGKITITLGYREPFQWTYFVNYLGPRGAAGVEYIDEQVYSRSIVVDGKPYILEVRPDSDRHQLKVSFAKELTPHIFLICEKVRDIFDLRSNMAEIRSRLLAEKSMKAILRHRLVPRVPGCWDPFELGVRAIIGQQISVRGATTITNRLVSRLGTPLEQPCKEVRYSFPTPEAIMHDDLSGFGLTMRRISTLQTFARIVLEEKIFAAGMDLDLVRSKLLSIPGIGPWTVEYTAMRALRDPNAFPASDLGVRKALSGTTSLINAAEAAKIAAGWQPWRAYGVVTLWTSL